MMKMRIEDVVSILLKSSRGHLLVVHSRRVRNALKRAGVPYNMHMVRSVLDYIENSDIPGVADKYVERKKNGQRKIFLYIE